MTSNIERLLAWMGAAALAVPIVVAASHASGKAAAADWAADQRFEEEQARRQEVQFLQAWRSARAHARLGPAVRSAASADVCPVFGSGSTERASAKEASRPFVARHAPSPERWRGVAPASESAQGLFSEYISGPVVQAKCVNCHVEGGVSGHTRLVLSTAENPDHESLNLAAFQSFLETVEDGADRILNKVQGVGHGGGIQVLAGSADFANTERFLRLLGGGGTTGGLSPETLFDGVTMASPAKTLRRAALVFAGRLPTPAEISSVGDGEISSLRRAIRNLMAGPGFHEFLIRGSNDRLLTDRGLMGVTLDLAFESHFVELLNIHWEMAMAARNRGHEKPWDDPAFRVWQNSMNVGLTRAPLELIAHVVENDLPYTEILTADYIMANPFSAKAYGARTKFNDHSDAREFRESKIGSYYRTDDSKIFDEYSGGRRVVNPGNLKTDFPHAGILNTNLFLLRYPTTSTNRNRARSRWTYYHFLAKDIEKSASRTTDPVALADTNNPTLKNTACTVCHAILDPVAGAFQNYGAEGYYRDEYGGWDSLAPLYKSPEDGSISPYQEGDTWYRDMRAPGFGDEVAPNAENSLQWLAERIVEDTRFAQSAVKFWWPAVLGLDVVAPPEDSGDPGFEGLLVASAAQSAEVSRIADGFREGIAGGPPYNGKDLLAEIALSPWFRAESLALPDPQKRDALRLAGVERLLTPEELERKTQAITGYAWGRKSVHWRTIPLSGHLTENRGAFSLLYGGIDSDGITERSGEMTPLMAAVAQSHAFQASCPIIFREFYLSADSDRRLFSGIDTSVAPDTEELAAFDVTSDGYAVEEGQLVSLPITLSSAAPTTLRVAYINNYWERPGGPGHHRRLYVGRILIRDQTGAVVGEFEPESFPRQYCGEPSDIYFDMWNNCSLNIPVEVDSSGEYTAEVVAWQAAAGPDPARLEISVLDGTASFDVRPVARDEAEGYTSRTNNASHIKFVRVAFTNDYCGESGCQASDRNLRVDRVTVRDAAGTVVEAVEAESLPNKHCGAADPQNGHYLMWGDCALSLPVAFPSDDEYSIEVVAWQDAAGSDPARMEVDLLVSTMESDVLTEVAWIAPQRISWQTNVRAAVADSLRISFTNDYWEQPGGKGHNRDLLLGHIEIRDSGGRLVKQIAPLSLQEQEGCGRQSWDRYEMWDNCTLDVPVAFPADGNYSIDVAAWQSAAGPDPARLELSIITDSDNSRGSIAIRQKLVELHHKLLGVEVARDSTDVDEAYRLFLQVWERNRQSSRSSSFLGNETCGLATDHFFYDGLIDNPLERGEFGDSEMPWEAVVRMIEARNTEDPGGAARAWVVVLAYLLTDYRYLYL